VVRAQPYASCVVDIFEELLARAQDRSHNDTCWDVDASEVLSRYAAEVAELSERWGTPCYTGTKWNMPETEYDFRRLHIDFGRAWLVTWWEAGEDILVAMVVDHDAGTLQSLEYEASAKARLR